MLETALIGRHPHLPFWQWEEAADFAAARAALAAVGLDAIAGRAVDSLSGGERRRLDIATLLTQDAAVCLLDEPSNHLDPRHRNEMLAIFRARADAGGLVIAALHDPTLAARAADKALLLFGDGRWRFGAGGVDPLGREPLRAVRSARGRNRLARPARVRQRLTTSRPGPRGSLRAARRSWRGCCGSARPIGAPSRSVTRPPASSTITVSAAMSRMLMSLSSTASILPAASRW